MEIITEQKPVSGARPLRYVPATVAAREELGLTAGIELDEAIRRTAAWYTSKACSIVE
jgi:nucleoside-diphosphate-sugar epimerase